MSDLTPTEGARFLLECEPEMERGGEHLRAGADVGTRAVYRAAIYTPETTYEGTVTLDDDGSVTLAIDAPGELRDMLEMLGKLTARAAAKKRADGLPAWPARVLRWRGPGRGA